MFSILKHVSTKATFVKSIHKFLSSLQLKIPAKSLVEQCEQKLRNASIEDAEFNVKCIIAHVLQKRLKDVLDVKSEILTETQVTDINRLCDSRAARVPLQYILGEWDFLDITLKMQPPVFIPRPETENFVSLLIENLISSEKKKKDLTFLDIGCGSGAISVAILYKCLNTRGYAVDRSLSACHLTATNAIKLNVNNRLTLAKHKIDENLVLPENFPPKFDIIISNPPYIKTKDISGLQTEIKLYENVNALDGGKDGLNVARLICDLSIKYLSEDDGKLWMELDESQLPEIEKEINSKYESSLKVVNFHKDMFGKFRFIEILRI